LLISFIIYIPKLYYKDISARQVLVATTPKGKHPRDRPRSRWRDYISDLAWSRLGVEPTELLCQRLLKTVSYFKFSWAAAPSRPPER